MKFDAVRRLFSNKADAALITSEENRLYFTSFCATDGYLLITEDSVILFADSRYIEAAENTIKNAEIRETSASYPYSRAVADLIAENKVECLGFEEATMNVADYLVWSDKLSVKLIPSQKIFTDLRMVKSREELDDMIKAQRIAEKSFNEILPLISTDITEKELAAELMYRFLKNGAQDKSFDSIIVSGAHSSMPHGVPTDSKITKGFLTLDFGVKYNGWCSDTTRTVCIGKPTDEMHKVYDIVLRAQLAGIAAAKAGVTGSAIHNAGAKVIADAGYGPYFGHGFGHSLGLEIHESPSASPSNDGPMPEGAVVTAEPGIYLPGRFGVRIEDMLYLTAEGCLNLTKAPKELLILH